jgi:DNA invertase Pin-like site-specific DNA recombinase
MTPLCSSTVPLTNNGPTPTLSDKEGVRDLRRRKRKLHDGQRPAVGYVRVSTETQVSEGVSLEAQRARIEAWVEANSCELRGVHVDAGLSGGRADNRPALQAALAEVCRQKGALIVYSLSRLARSTKDAILIAERLERAGADLVSLSEAIDTSSAAGRLFFRLMAAMAEFERDVVAERTRTALAFKRSRGERVSRYAPFGYRFEAGQLVPNPEELQAAERARTLRATGLTYRGVVEALNRERVPCRGRRWHVSTVYAILSAA